MDSVARLNDADNKKAPTNSRVNFIAQFGHHRFNWQGKVIRSAGGRNEVNRLQYVIAEIDAPFAFDEEQKGRPALTPGTFVEAEIAGHLYRNVMVLPREALRSNQRLWLVDEQDRLLSREVNVLYRGKDKIYLAEGLKRGERVIVSNITVFMEGLAVNVVEEDERRFIEKDKPLAVPNYCAGDSYENY